MPARVVLPRPGGPAKSTWSTGWSRRRAASRMISSLSRNICWPTKSASRLGRIPTSKPLSPSKGTGSGAPAACRAPATPAATAGSVPSPASVPVTGPEAARISRRGLTTASPSRRQVAEGLAQQLFHRALRRQRPECGPHLFGRVAELGQCLSDLGRDGGGRSSARRAGLRHASAEVVKARLQLQQQPGGRPLPDPGDELQGLDVARSRSPGPAQPAHGC